MGRVGGPGGPVLNEGQKRELTAKPNRLRVDSIIVALKLNLDASRATADLQRYGLCYGCVL